MLPASSVSGDKYRFCPYDITHVILAKSFNAHLIKCRENHKGHKMAVCPFDHTHVVPKPELNHHLSQCDKRYLMDREMQKRAGDDVLKGDVMGPPIVADHSVGKDYEEAENWDDAPVRSVPTPALFNEKIKNTPRDSYGIIPGGGYLPPPAEEPKIRKIPNNPAKAATLSHPGAAQIRPSHNPVFEFSIGKNRMPRADGNTTRSPPGYQAVAPGAPGGMTGVQAPTCDQGPRFIGRGVSKYATKSNQGLSAHAPPGSPRSPPSKASKVPSPQFEDLSSNKMKEVAASAAHSKTAQSSVRNDGAGSLQESQQGNLDSSTPQEFSIQQSILLHLGQQQKQLKDQHSQQQKELAKKHDMQTQHLKKLQNEEKKKLVLEQERQEMELFAKTQALSQTLQEMSSVSSSSSSSSLSSSQMDPAIQNVMAPGILDALMALGGNSLSGILSSMGLQGDTDTSNTHESSRLTVQDSNDSDTVKSTNKPKKSPAESRQTKTMLQNALREIEILEHKSMAGHVLSEAEESKLLSKDSLLERLAALPSS